MTDLSTCRGRSVAWVALLGGAWLFVSGPSIASDPDTRVTIEAEDAVELLPPFAITDDPVASGRKCIHIPNRTCIPTADPPGDKKNGTGRARYVFTIRKTGRYYLWGRKLWPNACGNTVMLKIDDRPDQVFGGDGTYGQWDWLMLKVQGGLHLDAGTHTLLIKNREDGVKLDQILVTSVDPDAGGVPVGMEQAGTPPADTIAFDDDFMRAKDETDPWEGHNGAWQLDTIPKPKHSANAFRYRNDGAGPGFCTAGHLYWHDYAFSCAVRPGIHTTGAGIACYVRDPRNYVLFRWLRTGRIDTVHRRAEGAFELVSVVNGTETVIGERKGVIDPCQWYELVLINLGQQVLACVDSVALIRAPLPDAGSGRIGLWTRDAARALFDDVSVRGSAGYAKTEHRRPATCIMERIFGPRQPVIGRAFAADALMRGWSSLRINWPVMAGQETTSLNDYTFHSAPVDWRTTSGSWQTVSRWICSPQWSWLGGTSHETATIWTKQQYMRNQGVDLYTSVMMTYGRQFKEQPFGYQRLGDLNITFCADGRNLGSGYTFMFGGFDNSRTCLWRKDRIVAESRKYLYPRVKGHVHRRWFNIRAEKIGANIRCLVDGNAALTYDDPNPLDGGHVAVWTWDGGIIIPRVRIFAENIKQPVSPFIKHAFTRSEGGSEFSAISVQTRREYGRDCTTFINPQSGGDLTAPIRLEPFDARKLGKLSFGYRFPPQLRVHLYLKANGRDFFVALNAPASATAHLIRESVRVVDRTTSRARLTGTFRIPVHLTSVPVFADDRWHTFRIDLAGPLHQFFPHADKITVSNVRLANWCNTDYLMCGFGGNHKGITWHVDDVRLDRSTGDARSPCPVHPEEQSARSDTKPATEDRDPPPAPYVALIPNRPLVWDDFETGAGQWCSRRGGTGQRTNVCAATGQFCYQADGYSTFAVYTPFDASLFPVVRFDYRLEPGAMFNWVIRTGNQNWEIRCNANEPKVKVIADIPGIKADGQWHRAKFSLTEIFGRLPDSSAGLIIDHIATYNRGKSGRWFDNFTVGPAQETAPLFTWSIPRDPAGITGYSVLLDTTPTTIPDEQVDTTDTHIQYEHPAAGTHYLHVRACDGAGNWGPAGHASVVIATTTAAQ